MDVLIGCEFTGTVRDAFSKGGFQAMSCDLLPGLGEGSHYQGDIRDILQDQHTFKGMHPDCTFMTNAASWVCTIKTKP